MTWSTSEVAVCCCNDSVRSVVRCAQFVEQPRVLDGDHGLGSKVRHQFDLLVGEGTNLLTIYSDCTNKCVLLEHRDNEKCSSTTAINERDERRKTSLVGWLRPEVGDVNGSLCLRETSERNAWIITYDNRRLA